MRLRALFPFLLLYAATACGGEAPMVGQFGQYYKENKQLRLASGDTYTVYRVKSWTFNDGNPPALQLEYEAPTSVDDTVALKALARRIWPAFAPYVQQAGVSTGIITATNLRRKGFGGAWKASIRSYGLIAHRDSAGVWRLVGDFAPLPPAEAGGGPRIFEANGDPLVLQTR